MANEPDPRNSFPTKFWTGGVNSLIFPGDISSTEYAWGENVINRGGVVQTRPGFRLCASIIGNNLQGFASFTPLNSTPRLVCAVDGHLYVGRWPATEFVKVSNIEFDPHAKLVHICQCTRSTRRNADGSISIVEPYRMLIISDGTSRAWSWDGSTSVKLNPGAPAFQTPIGTWMIWTASRLWIACGSQVRASDLGDPTSFFDDTVLATRSYFTLPNVISGMIETANERGLLVFTENTTTVFKSYILDRLSWGSTQDFAKLVFPNIGCDAGRTACNQYGMTYWHSTLGMVNLDAAMNTDHTSKLTPVDDLMMRSKRNLAPDMSGACAIAFDNILLMSMPSGGKLNEQTWALDQSPLGSILESITAWAGIWTGIRPVQWATGRLCGHRRLFCASFDKRPVNGTYVHIWEGMRDERVDAEGRISCLFEMAVAESDRLHVFKYAEFEVVELLGEVHLDVYVCGTRGPWIQYPYIRQIITNETILQSYKPQSRTDRTEEFSSQGKADSPENSGNRPGLDKGFRLLFVWKGRMGIRAVRLILNKAQESDRGKCSPSEEGQINIVNEEGIVTVYP